MSEGRNRLANETSPYLLQHAHNPVDWYPWGKEALTRAVKEDKPILLSIGYSACHWCHVMARESFEDDETAALMNGEFVNIKVDREERPDLDKIYQLAHQLLAQRPGGWPLTVFLTPQQLPFFAGTYFPAAHGDNMPSFREVLQNIAAAYREQGEAIAEQNQALLEAMENTVPQTDDAVEMGPSPLDASRREMETQFDSRFGGFGQAPKFPHPTRIERLLRHWQHTRELGHEDKRALELALASLHAMASGGIFDQIGGGFCRYSTDDAWRVPHFEKMLYDNGQLLGLYSEAWLAMSDPVFARIVHETAGWLMREMQGPEGGYYSAQGADSEGKEGRFYVWSPQQVEALLGDDETRVIRLHYGFDHEPNFQAHWYPHIYQSLEEIAEALEMPPRQVRECLDSGRERLRQARELRPRPATDTKVITAWNGLMIKGMATAGRIFEREDYIDSAQRAVDFIRQHLWQRGRLLSVYSNGQARQPAYLDDYALLLDALLSLLQARWRREDCNFAIDLAETLLAQFEDIRGGFFYTAHDHEPLIHRPKPTLDEAIPSANGAAAIALQRLGHLLGEQRYLEAAERTLRASWTPMSHLADQHSALLTALEEWLYPPRTIIIRAPGRELHQWHESANRHYAPRQFVYAIDSSEKELPGQLAHKDTGETGACAWICEGGHHLTPFSTRDELQSHLESETES
ncbi:MAG: thioredoxin domain-containing protein [Gammaproteobacteria bacterium]|nr:thioredoxin domain-containing protein [Gammaproteobacteria bacterium]